MIKNDKEITDNFLGGRHFQLLPDEVICDVVGGKLSSNKKVVLLSSIITSVVVLAAAVVAICYFVPKIKNRNVNQKHSFDRPFITHSNRMMKIKIIDMQGGTPPFQVEVTSWAKNMDKTMNKTTVKQIDCKSYDDATRKQEELVHKYRSKIRTYFGSNTGSNT